MKPSPHIPLTDAEFDALDDLLARFPDAPSLEELDGLMCAIAIGPQEVPAEEWLTAALGAQDLANVAADDIQRVLALVRRHEVTIATGLREDWSGVTAEEGPDAMYFPLLDDPKQSGFPLAEGWARGFQAGLDWLEDAHIDALEEDAQAMQVLNMIGALDSGELQGGKRLTDAQRDEVVPAMAAGLQYLYAFWRGWVRVTNAPREPYRADAVPGRNDPCPCGSGRKFKKCHGAPDRMH
ncbi:MAG: UPF0149 family protein [Rhodocyclaceae bacterium]